MSVLRIFLPADERIDARGPLRWLLLDRRSVVRESRSAPKDMPRADEIEAILPAARVLFARLKLPRVSDTTIRELLPFAVEDRLLADPAQIHAVAGATEGRGETTVAVVDRQWLRAALGAISPAARAVRHAWCESALVPASASDWHLVLRADAMIVGDAGVATTFDWQGEAALPLALRIALDEAAARGDRPRRVVVHEDSDATAADLARWSSDSGVTFERGSAWRALEPGPVATGAIDLLSGDFAPRRGGVRELHVPRAALALAAAIALVQFGFTGADTWRLQRERARLEAEREAAFRAAFPEARVVVDPDLQMQRNLAQLRAARGMASGDDFLVKLSAAARESGSAAVSVDYAQGKLTVRRAGATR